MNALKKTAYLGIVISAVALSGCLSGGGGGSSIGAPAVQVPIEEKTQAQRIADGDFKIAQADITADFAPIEGAEQFAGVLDGAIYRIEVPDNWNGTLIMWAHGFRGDEPSRLRVDNHPLREYLLSLGYAWAASSYSANFYDVRAGVVDTNKLALSFSELTGLQQPDRYLISGFSMGGHVAGAAVERENKLALAQVDLDVDYEGALPMC
ncbi:MAG: alpha/beta hydrolase, partial [Pseudomonas sp.]